MTTATRKEQVPARLVARMVKFYGSVEAAREAYKAERETVRGADRLRGGLVLWVAGTGRIMSKESGDIFYRGSADAHDVLPS